jgi:hypothetical protein
MRLPSDYLEAGRAPRLTEVAQVIRSCKSFGMVAFASSKSKAPDQDGVPIFPEVKHKGQLILRRNRRGGVAGSLHAPICPKPAQTLPGKDWRPTAGMWAVANAHGTNTSGPRHGISLMRSPTTARAASGGFDQSPSLLYPAAARCDDDAF